MEGDEVGERRDLVRRRAHDNSFGDDSDKHPHSLSQVNEGAFNIIYFDSLTSSAIPE